MNKGFVPRRFSAIESVLSAYGEAPTNALERFRAGELQDRPTAAVAIYRDPSIATAEIFSAAEEAVREARGLKRSTFVPIFTTNHCDCECVMCGMRKSNVQLDRKFSGKRVIEEQLDILYNVEQVRAVGFLTGEFEGAYTRKANAFLTGWAVRRALDIGFERVYFNIGSLIEDEVEVLGDWLHPGEKVTMCVFQETYDREAYVRFMGRKNDNVPKSDYLQRIRSFDNWLDAGFHQVNPGFLVGLHQPEEDLAQLVAHVEYLSERGADVCMSVPRLRPALGSGTRSKVKDEAYIRLIATLALMLPQVPIVLTTRETQEFQDTVLPVIGTLSPGSPDVSPYRRHGEAANAPESSQFLIPDHRRPIEILERVARQGYQVEHFAARLEHAS